MKPYLTAAILLSRQALRPCGTTPWVGRAVEAVRWVKRKGYRLLTSTGMQTWEMLVYLAQSRNVGQTIFVPATGQENFKRQIEELCFHFDLNRSFTAFERISNQDRRGKNLQFERDRKIIFDADILLPVSVRSGGHMEKLIGERKNDGHCRIIDRFRIEHDNRPNSVSYSMEKAKPNSRLLGTGNKHLIHWTRATNGPWPGEKKRDYFFDLLKSESYPRDGFHTLQNILKAGRIAASSLHMPKGVCTVSFSGLSPEKAARLMKWRSRYRIMSFEPYGVGIERKIAETLGILPVRYHPPGAIPSDAPSWLLQSEGLKTDWKKEEEYRYPADFDLSLLDRGAIVCFCRRHEEAEQIRERFGIASFHFEK